MHEAVLVLQWTATSMDDYDLLVLMDDALEDALEPDHTVDGHDFGSGEMNIFILTDDPVQAFEHAGVVLGCLPQWTAVRAAWRSMDSDDFTILWPAGLRAFSVQ